MAARRSLTSSPTAFATARPLHGDGALSRLRCKVSSWCVISVRLIIACSTILPRSSTATTIFCSSLRFSFSPIVDHLTAHGAALFVDRCHLFVDRRHLFSRVCIRSCQYAMARPCGLSQSACYEVANYWVARFGDVRFGSEADIGACLFGSTSNFD